MSYKNSKKNKGLVGGIVAVLATMLVVGGLGALSKGFKDWNVKGWFEKTSENVEKENRVGLHKVDLKTDVKGSALTNTTLISYLNEGLGDSDPIFKDVAFVYETTSQTGGTSAGSSETPIAPDDTPQEKYLLEYVFKDNGGMKFGTSNNLGSFTVNLVEGTTFNRVKITGRNYCSLNSTTGVYLCDESSIIVNGAEKQIFGTNAEDTTKEAPIEDKLFTFATSQNQLSISVLGKRATIFTIELWTEVAPTSQTSVGN